MRIVEGTVDLKKKKKKKQKEEEEEQEDDDDDDDDDDEEEDEDEDEEDEDEEDEDEEDEDEDEEEYKFKTDRAQIHVQKFQKKGLEHVCRRTESTEQDVLWIWQPGRPSTLFPILKWCVSQA